MGTFRAELEAYGADYEATMARFLGDEALYKRLLELLFRDDNLQRLGTALDEGDFKGAFEAAHTLKGVVGNMGLTPLYQAVCAIVEPLRASQQRTDYQALYEDIRREFQAADALRARLNGEA